ncbi:MAG TPA: hypothetical protein VNI58_02260 [Mariprofundaceae bacterium]|nr:hypothetical protein [Mariprofundaceae bacterium]
MSIKPLSFSSLRTVPLAKRKVDSDGHDFGAPYQAGSSFADFLCSLPNLGAGSDLFLLRDAIVTARRHKHEVILACGSHVFASGLSPLLSRLIEKRVVTGLALTGAALLQDVEIALAGRTVAAQERELADGRFCMTEETGKLINEAIDLGASENWGIGQSVGKHLMDAELEHLDHSVVATAFRYGVPVTVHPAIGADAFNLHPAAHGESIGAAGMTDLRLLAGMMAEANHGVVINIASSVVMPQVLLQAVDAARNLGKKVESLTSAVIDAAASSFAVNNVVTRLSQPGGRGIWIQGADEIIVPLLFAAVMEVLGKDSD